MSLRSAVLLSLGMVCFSGLVSPTAQGPADWPMAGQNLSNTRAQPAEDLLGPGNVPALRPKWVFTTGDDVSATPAVADEAVYVPDWAGNLFKINASTGAGVWAHQLSEYTGTAPTISRTTPALGDGRLYLGTLAGAYLLAIDSTTGGLIWKTQLSAHPGALITQSPVVFQQRVYVGVSSKEEIMALVLPHYQCCTFRGSVVALDAPSGRIVWQSYTTPDNGGRAGGYAGNAVWGSTPVVDALRNALYITTGNNYNVPAWVKACEAARRANPTLPSCVSSENYVDAIVALDLDTGAVKWSNKLQGYDAWNFACVGLRHRPNCPEPTGPDFDFGQGPMLFTVVQEGHARQLLGAGQKSGIFWALDPETGAVVWSTVVGPSGGLGGIMWGSATEASRVYVAVANSAHQTYTLVPSGEQTQGGAWSALDAATGTIIWQTAVPLGNLALGPVSVANGVVYGGSMAESGENMFALDGASGAILWGYASGGSVNAGPAVVHGMVYWGSGYAHFGQGSGNNQLYAFGLAAGGEARR